MKEDSLIIGGEKLNSRLFIGTGKYVSDAIIPDIVKAAGIEVMTVALRRIDLNDMQHNVLSFIPKHIKLLPNTSGAKTAEDAIHIAHLSKAAGCGNWIKLEVIDDPRHLLPDGFQTLKATEQLVKEGFVVLPYINPDRYLARDLINAGAAAVMPLGAPIGSNRGLKMKEMIGILIEESTVPVIVDAGLGMPSHACEAMELGAAACLINTAIATSGDPVSMASAFTSAIRAGREAFLAGAGRVLSSGAEASSPLTGTFTK